MAGGGGGKKDKAKKEPPVGIQFPVTNQQTGERSSTVIAKEILAASVVALDKTIAEKVLREKKWRYGYGKHIQDNLTICTRNPAAAYKVCNAGLDKVYDTFEFIQPDGQVFKFKDAISNVKQSFFTHTVKGLKPKPNKLEFAVPYKVYHTNEFKELKGAELIKQIDRWVKRGTIEPDCGEALKEVVNNPGYLDLSGETFVLLGATSAMGPFTMLKDLGAHIIAVDIDRPHLWKRMIEAVKDSHASITFPLKQKYEGQSGDDLYNIAGSNLMTETPQICNWLTEVVPKICNGKKVTIGNYTYLDGDKHVRVTLACDAAFKTLIQSYGASKVRTANLATPTDFYLVPEKCAEASKASLKKAPTWMKALATVMQTQGKMVPNVIRKVEADNLEPFFLLDGLLMGQGPNYALSKRMQQWRGVLSYQQGAEVSLNIAPATATASVLSNKVFAAAYGGMHVFEPMEIFHEELSQAVMGGLLVYDIKSPNTPSKPGNAVFQNPFQLFWRKSFHGGVGRCLYKFDSIGEAAVIVNYLAPESIKNPQPKKK